MVFQTQTYQDKKLGQKVTENLKAAEVLEENNIDFCCGGDKTLEEACSFRKRRITFMSRKMDAIHII